MNLKFFARPLSSNLPICRNQLYEDVICSGKYGPVHRVWFSPGHVFVAVRKGTQLFTFDTKPTNKIVEEYKGCLDLQGLNPPICDILVSGINYSLVYIIQINGCVQCWKYRTDYTWVFLQRFDICSASKSEIVSICLHPSQNTLYWCEKQSADIPIENLTYCICKRQLPDDEEKIKEKDLSPVTILLHNCPTSIVYPSMSGLMVFIRNKEPLISMLIAWKTASSKISVFMGSHQVDLEDLGGQQQGVDFKKLAFKLIGTTTKITDSERLRDVIYNPNTIEVRMIEQSGTVRRTVDKTGGDLVISLKMEKDASSDIKWFDFQGIIGAVTNSDIRLYNSSTGQFLRHVQSPDNTEILSLCDISSGMVFNGFYTSQNIYVLERRKQTEKENIERMLSTKNFQTDAVQLSYFEQQKYQCPSSVLYEKITKLRQSWELEMDKLPSTKLIEILNPYLKEYWKLEDLQQRNLDNKLSFPTLCPRDIEDEVLHVLSPETNMKMTARQSWLLLLADTFPQELQRWQCILAPDTVDSPVSSDVAVPMFEHICRLLFKIQPNKLLQYYDRALECLPDLSISACFDDAITAHVQLMLASEQEDCVMHAIELLMKHNQWVKTLDLLKKQTDTPQYYKLFLSTITAMSDEKVLSQFADEIFSLMPELKSFSVLSSVLSNNDKMDDRKETATTQDVFVQNLQDIRIDTVRSYILKKIATSNKNS
ncbi:hypothetical protein KUTeg_016926 [Tegillarca granosa]|uniref:BLOC-2 complex member HPS6 N-terminal domain-containing protein n=1 Tax=Tegillarca granosa TaxID=220873 RepID=A0ABQ9EMB9_TEGGR|nr:hypothetical protein KUTeg_016926 [Tegillarca granosa]